MIADKIRTGETHKQSRAGVRDLLLLARYHLRVMQWPVWLLIAFCFLVAGAILWLMRQIHYPVMYQQELSRFILEPGAGLIACMVGGALLVNDPALELLLVAHQGIRPTFMLRVSIAWLMLGVPAALFALWSLRLGTDYFHSFSWWRMFCLWFIPTWLCTQLSFFAALLTRQARMGGVIGGSLILLELFMKDLFLQQTLLRWLFVPLSLWLPNTSIWGASRALLFCLGTLLLAGSWWWMEHEERLLGALTSQ